MATRKVSASWYRVLNTLTERCRRSISPRLGSPSCSGVLGTRPKRWRSVGAAVLSRAEGGDVGVKEVGDGEVGGGALIGALGGLVVGLFAPPLLLSTGIGAGIGAGVGALMKHHEEKAIGVDAEEYLPPGSSAIVGRD